MHKAQEFDIWLVQKQIEMQDRYRKKCQQPKPPKPTEQALARRNARYRYLMSQGQLPCNPKTKKFFVLERERRGEICCDICREPLADKRACVDHSHVTNHIRGWICQGCNVGIGGLRDNITNLRNAERYLIVRAYGNAYESISEPTQLTNPAPDTVGEGLPL